MRRESLGCGSTYIRVVLDLLKGGIVELSGVGVPGTDVEGVLNTNGVTPGQAAAVDVVDPAQVRFSAGITLESDDVLAGDHIALGGGRSGRSQGGGEDGAQEKGYAAKAMHVCDGASRTEAEEKKS